MSDRSLTVTIPERLYAQIKAQAQSSAQPIDTIIVQTLVRNLVQLDDSDLPPDIQTELAAMAYLSDEALWAIARSTANSDKVALFDLLVERKSDGKLTPEGQQWLTRLRNETDALTLRKAHSYTLLQQRGHQLPTLAELRAQMP